MKEASLSIVEDVENGRYLMVRNYRGINKGCLNFPGGKKEPGEDMLHCVVRETLEETGIAVKNPVKVGYVEFPTMDFYVSFDLDPETGAVDDDLQLPEKIAQ